MGGNIDISHPRYLPPHQEAVKQGFAIVNEKLVEEGVPTPSQRMQKDIDASTQSRGRILRITRYIMGIETLSLSQHANQARVRSAKSR